MITKRALLAIEFLQNSPNRSVHSFQLNGPLRTNFSPRAIYEARKGGYIITSTNEKLGNAWGVRYALVSCPPQKIEAPKPRPRLVFDAIRQVYIEVRETINQTVQPIQVVQEALL